MSSAALNLPCHGLIGLPKRGVLALPGRRGERIESLRGSVWLTQDDDPRDLVLAPGRTLVIERDGPLLLQALEAALVSVHAAPAPVLPSRWQRLRYALAPLALRRLPA